jgi:hypothetical protein
MKLLLFFHADHEVESPVRILGKKMDGKYYFVKTEVF